MRKRYKISIFNIALIFAIGVLPSFNILVYALETTSLRVPLDAEYARLKETLRTGVTGSHVRDFCNWDGVVAINKKGATIITVQKSLQASSFDYASPADWADGLKHFINTGEALPINVDIDITNICNNDCIMCFNKKFREQHRKFIPKERLKRILDDLARIGTRSIRFTGGGDALTHKDVIELIEYAHQLGFRLMIETNGDLLNNEKIIEVLAKYMDHVRISVDSSCNSTRINVHRPVKPEKHIFDALVKNMENLVRKRKELGRQDSLLLGATFIILPENYKEISDFIKRMKKIGLDWVTVRKTADRSIYREYPEMSEEAIKQLEDCRKEESGPRFKIIDPYSISENPPQEIKKCFVPLVRFIILATSEQAFCCLARNRINVDKYILGKIRDEENPITKLSGKNRRKIERFLEEAPKFCPFCPDREIIAYHEKVWNILQEEAESNFFRMRIHPYHGAKILFKRNSMSRDAIFDIYLPFEYYERFKKGEPVDIDFKDMDGISMQSIKESIRGLDLVTTGL